MTIIKFKNGETIEIPCVFPDDIVKPDIRDQLIRLEWDDNGKQYCLKFNPVDVLYVKEITPSYRRLYHRKETNERITDF